MKQLYGGRGNPGVVPTDPIWADVVTATFFVLALITIAVAVGALVQQGVKHWREADR